jgi:hypothetical protein
MAEGSETDQTHAQSSAKLTYCDIASKVGTDLKGWFCRVLACLNRNQGSLLALFTLLLVGVGILQWCTLRATDETARLNNRSQIYFDKILAAAFNLGPEKVIGVSLGITNSGNIPPRNLKFAVACPPRDAAQAISDPFSLFSPDFSTALRENVGPKQVVRLGACSLHADEVLAVQSGKTHRYVVAEAIYQDRLTPGMRITRFSAQIFFSNFSDADHPFNWNSESRGNNNCTDEDCEEVDRMTLNGSMPGISSTATTSTSTLASPSQQ